MSGERVKVATLRDQNPWLAAEDIFDRPITVKIADVQMHRDQTMENGRKEDVLALDLTTKSGRPLTKRFILSKTNIRALKMGLRFGSAAVGWIGKEVGLWAAELKKRTFDRHYGIRIAVDDPKWIDKTIVGDGRLPDDVRKALGWK